MRSASESKGDSMIERIIAGFAGLSVATVFSILFKTQHGRIKVVEEKKVDKDMCGQIAGEIKRDLDKGEKRFEKIDKHMGEQTKVLADQSKTMALLGQSVENINGTLVKMEKKINKG